MLKNMKFGMWSIKETVEKRSERGATDNSKF